MWQTVHSISMIYECPFVCERKASLFLKITSLFSRRHVTLHFCINLSKSFVKPANGFVTEGKQICYRGQRDKHAEFRYPVTQFISSNARGTCDRFVEPLSHKMTIHPTIISVCFVQRKFFTMLKTSLYMKGYCWTRSGSTR